MADYPAQVPALGARSDLSPATPDQHSADHSAERDEILAIAADLMAAMAPYGSMEELINNLDAGASGMLNGAGPPAPSTGANTNFYIDTLNHDLYGPKTAGDWGAPFSLQGDPGPTGSGVPPGGDPLDLLAKQSAADGDIAFMPVPQIAAGEGIAVNTVDDLTIITNLNWPHMTVWDALNDPERTFLTNETLVLMTGNITSNVTAYLPLANSVPSGTIFTIVDFSGNVDTDALMIVQVQSGNALQGGLFNLAAYSATPGGSIQVVSNGFLHWKVINFMPPLSNDALLAKNSALLAPTQFAVKSYVDGVAGGGYTEWNGETVTTYTASITDRHIGQVGTLTAHRTVVLPDVSSVPNGREITVVDESGSATSAHGINIARQGTDGFVDGIVGLPATVIRNPFGSKTLMAIHGDGISTVDRWKVLTSGVTYIDPDGGLVGNNDLYVPTQKAVKTYVDSHVSGGSWTAWNGLTSNPYTIPDIAINVGQTATITANISATLPLTTVVGPGYRLTVKDLSGSVDSLAGRGLVIARKGSDLIDGATLAFISTPRGGLTFVSDGAGTWSIVGIAGMQTSNAVALGTSHVVLPTQAAVKGYVDAHSAAPARTGLRLDRSTVQPYGTAGQVLPISWNTELEDTNSVITVPTTSVNIPVAGVYAITVKVDWSAGVGAAGGYIRFTRGTETHDFPIPANFLSAAGSITIPCAVETFTVSVVANVAPLNFTARLNCWKVSA